MTLEERNRRSGLFTQRSTSSGAAAVDRAGASSNFVVLCSRANGEQYATRRRRETPLGAIPTAAVANPKEQNYPAREPGQPASANITVRVPLLGRAGLSRRGLLRLFFGMVRFR